MFQLKNPYARSEYSVSVINIWIDTRFFANVLSEFQKWGFKSTN